MDEYRGIIELFNGVLCIPVEFNIDQLIHVWYEMYTYIGCSI